MIFFESQSELGSVDLASGSALATCNSDLGRSRQLEPDIQMKFQIASEIILLEVYCFVLN